MSILIKNGRVIDPATATDQVMDLYVEGSVIQRREEHIDKTADRTIDAKGCFVMPGFIDLHVHLRDPGLEYKETVETGAAAAAKGGYTTILAMPNTKPVADCAQVIDYVHRKAADTAKIHVYQVGAITKGQQGEELAAIEEMIDAGSPALSEDGKSVMNAQLYKEAMKIAAKRGVPILAHCEDINMVNGGVMNEDARSAELGMPGICNAVEDVIVARDILLAKDTGAALHLCHCSTKDSVTMVKLAKEEGLPVTAEVCPHHFVLSTEDIKEDDANYKMNPPLRTREDVEALIGGLRDGIMDVISTDHAPHSAEEKNQSMRKAPFGIVGSETVAALTYTKLVDTGILTPMQMAEKMSYNPSKVLGKGGGTLKAGAQADIVIFDPNAEYRIDKNTFLSKGKNTPFDGWQVKGEVRYTICGGEIAYEKSNTPQT